MTRVVDLSLRAEPIGGEIAAPRLSEAGEAVDPVRLAGVSHLVVMLHGFNVDADEADAGYRTLARRLADAAGSGRDWAFGATVLRVFWPGDADWGLFSPLVYPAAIGTANRCAVLLAEWLTSLGRMSGGGLQVDWLCHSLGNRVALGAMAALDPAAPVRARRVLHLAAAVPTRQLERSGDAMRRGLDQALLGFGATSVHSACDAVLSLAFPLGETLAGTQGFLPTALGHAHWPAGDARSGFAQAARDHLGHGDYWDGVDTALVHAALDLPVAVPRRIEAGRLPPPPQVEADPLPWRETPWREGGLLFA